MRFWSLGAAGRNGARSWRRAAAATVVLAGLMTATGPAAAKDTQGLKQRLWREVIEENGPSQMVGKVRLEVGGSSDDRVDLRAIPEIRVTAGTGFRWFGAMVGFLVTVIPAALCGSEPLMMDPGDTAYRFKRELSRLDLLLDRQVVAPLAVDKVCKPRYDVPYGRKRLKTRTKKVRGCYQVYQYPAEVFVAGAPLAVRIYEGDKPARVGHVLLEPALLADVR
jgi:hypothetical protein